MPAQALAGVVLAALCGAEALLVSCPGPSRSSGQPWQVGTSRRHISLQNWGGGGASSFLAWGPPEALLVPDLDGAGQALGAGRLWLSPSRRPDCSLGPLSGQRTLSNGLTPEYEAGPGARSQAWGLEHQLLGPRDPSG